MSELLEMEMVISILFWFHRCSLNILLFVGNEPNWFRDNQGNSENRDTFRNRADGILFRLQQSSERNL